MPGLGVCLGMQLLCSSSAEGPGEGLGLLAVDVRELGHPRLPHIGWNTVEGAASDEALEALEGRHVYYVHSYVLPSNTPGVIATSTYGDTFPAIVRYENALATQFHPEKSSDAGRLVIDAFADLVEEHA
jgi:imidazole glycerol phosphate synthase glutamine amidotransferase subunit